MDRNLHRLRILVYHYNNKKPPGLYFELGLVTKLEYNAEQIFEVVKFLQELAS